jgi:hypothetical protein
VIEVKLDSTPIDVKPYKYPHHHKLNIERLIHDILRCGLLIKEKALIQPMFL